MTQNMKTLLPETTSQLQQSLISSFVSSLLLTTVLYPIDLSHTRMSTDMSKKQSLFVNKNATGAGADKLVNE